MQLNRENGQNCRDTVSYWGMVMNDIRVRVKWEKAGESKILKCRSRSTISKNEFCVSWILM